VLAERHRWENGDDSYTYKFGLIHRGIVRQPSVANTPIFFLGTYLVSQLINISLNINMDVWT